MEVRWTVSPSEERSLIAVTQAKHLLFLCFDLFSRFFWIGHFFLFLPPTTPNHHIVVFLFY